MVRWRAGRYICTERHLPVRCFLCTLLFASSIILRYLLNGNILAARTFIKHFLSGLPKTYTPSANIVSIGDNDEVVITSDPLINFCQLAIVTCQRADGDQNKVARESWVRLCGTYLSQGGPLAAPEVRKACLLSDALRTY